MRSKQEKQCANDAQRLARLAEMDETADQLTADPTVETCKKEKQILKMKPQNRRLKTDLSKSKKRLSINLQKKIKSLQRGTCDRD